MTKKDIDTELKDIDKKLKDIGLDAAKKVLNVEIPIPKPKIKVQNKTPYHYIFTGILLLLSICSVLIPAIFGVNIIFIVIISIFMFPVFSVSLLYLAVRIYIDWNKIKGVLIVNLPTEYIILNFFMPQKKIKKVIALINNDGVSCNVGKRKYIVEQDCIWLDDKGRPNQYHLPNIPNPIKFNFGKYLEEFFKALKDGIKNAKTGDNIVEQIQLELEKLKDWDNKPVDIAYSSENLEKLKNDKIFSEFHEKPSMNDIMKVVVVMSILLGIALLIILIALVVG